MGEEEEVEAVGRAVREGEAVAYLEEELVDGRTVQRRRRREGSTGVGEEDDDERWRLQMKSHPTRRYANDICDESVLRVDRDGDDRWPTTALTRAKDGILAGVSCVTRHVKRPAPSPLARETLPFQPRRRPVKPPFHPYLCQRRPTKLLPATLPFPSSPSLPNARSFTLLQISTTRPSPKPSKYFVSVGFSPLPFFPLRLDRLLGLCSIFAYFEIFLPSARLLGFLTLGDLSKPLFLLLTLQASLLEVLQSDVVAGKTKTTRSLPLSSRSHS
ncbi:hypothetical protein HPP92_009333 [Vanilla planifolia]|uniref:Uncharacterized protein n=1 Tax=Vanilla planifolia TaxID=51239 RepID=A0A835V7B2_VANPL|nr:hypothetical protein HPP92_009333 [Vanilla planifolia]